MQLRCETESTQRIRISFPLEKAAWRYRRYEVLSQGVWWDVRGQERIAARHYLPQRTLSRKQAMANDLHIWSRTVLKPDLRWFDRVLYIDNHFE